MTFALVMTWYVSFYLCLGILQQMTEPGISFSSIPPVRIDAHFPGKLPFHGSRVSPANIRIALKIVVRGAASIAPRGHGERDGHESPGSTSSTAISYEKVLDAGQDDRGVGISSSDKTAHVSPRRRMLSMGLRNPTILKTLARMLYRQEIGTGFDRRSPSGYAALPVRIKINLTRACNLQCRMCIQDRKDSEKEKFPWNDPSNQLSLPSWARLLDQTAAFHPLLALTGGEPLLYPEFREFIAAAKARRLVVELVTNGTLLRREAEFLVESGVEFIIVSIDGPEEVHDGIRGVPGSFRRTLEGVAALLDARRSARTPGPLVSINCVISKPNLTRLPEMMPLAEGIGVDVLNYLHTIFDAPHNVECHNRIFTEEWARAVGFEIVTPSKPEGEYYETQIGPEDMPFLYELMERVQARKGAPMMVNFSPGLAREKLKPYYLDLKHPFTNACKCLWTDMRILPDGSVMPCLHVRAGNITRGSLTDVWNSPEMRNFRKIIAKGLFPGCARCCCRKY